MAAYKTVWFWDSLNQITATDKFVASFSDDTYPKPNCISGITQPNHSSCTSFTYADDAGRLVVAVVDDVHRNKPNMWFVRSYKDSSYPPLRTLVAFIGDQYLDGTILELAEAKELGIKPSDGCGYITWITHENIIQQITVKENHRRKGLSSKMLAVLDALIVADIDWSGNFVNGGSVTTGDGEKLRSAWVASGTTRVIERIGSVETS